MHSRAGRPERCLNKTARALGRDGCNKISQALERPNCDRDSLWTGAALVVVPAARSSSQGRGGSRSLLGPANGVGSEVLSVVPPGGSSEVVCSERLRIDWNNRRALVGITIC
jgi:hypothetical protein